MRRNLGQVAWVAEIRCSTRVAAKIAEQHRVTLDEAREAALFSTPKTQRWIDPADGRGERLAVRSTTATDRELLVILFQLGDDGTWALATAYPV